MKQALIFANGKIHDGPMVQHALKTAINPLIIAADGGARIAQHFKLPVDVVVGDMDSLSTQELDSLMEDGAEIQRHPPEKDFTDLELALYYARQQNIDWIRIIGGLGGRLDQMLANIYLLTLPVLENCDVRLVSRRQETCLLVPGTHIINGTPDDTISLLPIGGDAGGVCTEGLVYPLKRERLTFGASRGVSNVMQAATAKITVQTGRLLLIHTLGKA
jgi:thiamine pyrophosphokinase